MDNLKSVYQSNLKIKLQKYLWFFWLFSADFVSAAILISFCCVLGKASLEQLVTMATIEVVFQSINDYLCSNYLNVYMFLYLINETLNVLWLIRHMILVRQLQFIYFLAVTKILHTKKIENKKESSWYHSDLFSQLGMILS
jgi:hypothetical protein